MFWKNFRPLVIVVFLLSLTLPIFVIGGFSVRNLISDSFQTSSETSEARTMLFGLILGDQLDEEAGMRGYAATRQMKADVERLMGMLRDLDLMPALRLLADAIATNDRWQHHIAAPILANRTYRSLIPKVGETMVDHFRQDIVRIDEQIRWRQRYLAKKVQSSVDHINVLIFVAVFFVGMLAVSIGSLQESFLRRLDLYEKRCGVEKLQVLYEMEKKVSDMLQDAFVQKPLPKFSSVSLSATYIPAMEFAKVGGDWYEGVKLSEDRIFFAIGDVAGHGLSAAVSMNRTRQALLSAAMLDFDPASLLTRVNDELLQQNERMVTALCGYADSQAYQFTYATAGHPPPILVEPGMPPRFLQFGGLPLSAVRDVVYRTHAVQTVPGAMLVLYTDGLLEHSRDVLIGERLLLEAVVQSVRQAASEPATVIRDMIFRERAVRDDVAILTIAFTTGVVVSRDENTKELAS